MNTNSNSINENFYLLFTIPVVALIILCSSIGIFHETIYSKESLDWLAQTIGQDLSNLFFAAPVLIISAIFAFKGSRIGKIIWIGAMLTNIYSYAIYCFAVHFNFLFHVYCLILGLSLYSSIIFFKENINVNCKEWFKQGTATKLIGISLLLIAASFTYIWLSNSLPNALNGTVPDNIKKDTLLTNPVQVLDFSFYLPLMFIASYSILHNKNYGYLLAPMMMVFAILTNINIISLMLVTMQKEAVNTLPPVIMFSVLTIACLTILISFLRNTLKATSS